MTKWYVNQQLNTGSCIHYYLDVHALLPEIIDFV